MAKKGSRQREENISDFAGPDANKEAIEKLAQSAAEANKSAKKKGKNVGEASDESIAMHVNLIKAAELEWREARDKASQAQGVLRNRYKVAKGDGIDVDSLKAAFRIAERASGEVVSEQRNIGRYLRIMGAPIGTQWNLFEDTATEEGGKPAPAMDAELQGQHAYANNEPRENNPFQPGTQEHVDWGHGWNQAQTNTAMRMGPDARGAAAN